MRYSLLAAAFAGVVAAQASPTTLLPASQPSGCASTFQDGARFEVGIVNASAALAKRQTSKNFMLTLSNGVLTDSLGRLGYIAGTDQLQFDNPIQAGALITEGWSACPNGTLALASTLFYECLTTNANGSFFNLYDTPIGGQCDPAFLMIIPETPLTTSSSASRYTTVTSTYTMQMVSQLADGQPVVSTGSATWTTTIAYSTATGSYYIPPFNATPTGLMPFNAGSSLQPAFANGGFAFYAALVGAVGLAAAVL